MTEPRTLNVLIVEDESDIIKQYRSQLERIGNCTPTIATSFEDAETLLDSPRDFHLVILDLCIPPEPGIPVSDDNIEQGRILLERCIARDEYPIPGLLIVTGYLEKTDQEAEREKIKREFYCGELLFKNRLAPGNKEIERAVERVRNFLDIRVCGERLKDREEYLVRRVAIARKFDGFELFTPTQQQTTYLNDSPFDEESPRRFIGKPILPNGSVSLQEYYFSFVPSSQFEVIERRANDWGMGPSRAQILEKPRSNKRALFFYFLGTLIPVQSDSNEVLDPRITTDLPMETKRVKVYEFVKECRNQGLSVAALISNLEKIDTKYGQLTTHFVQKALAKRRKNGSDFTICATLTHEVGALDSKESDSIRKVSARFRTIHGKKKKGTG